MFFFNGRIRNAHIVPVISGPRSYTHKVGQSGIIAGCLLIILGLGLIVIGAVSETRKTTFFRLGIISLSAGFFFAMLLGFYTKLDVCYHNWVYGSHVTPTNMDTSTTATAGVMSVSYLRRASTIIHKPQAGKFASNKTISQIVISPLGKRQQIDIV